MEQGDHSHRDAEYRIIGLCSDTITGRPVQTSWVRWRARQQFAIERRFYCSPFDRNAATIVDCGVYRVEKNSSSFDRRAPTADDALIKTMSAHVSLPLQDHGRAGHPPK